MNSPEDKGYWTEQIGVFQREIAELEDLLSNNQNATSPDGEDTSEIMNDAETDLEQTKSALRHAKIELARIEQQEEIANIIPRMEELRNQIEMHKKIDVQEARELEEVLKELEARVEELRQDPVLGEEE